MARKRHIAEQIIRVLKEVEAGMRTPDVCRKHGISDAKFYKWKSRIGEAWMLVKPDDYGM